MPSWQDFEPFIVTGIAAGAVYAVSGVGMVVLYRTTGVLNLAFGAIGALGALICWSLINTAHAPDWLAYLVCVAVGGLVTLLYGMVIGPALAARDALVKATATIGLALILLGAMSWIWSNNANARSLTLTSDSWTFRLGSVLVNWTQIIALIFAVVVAVGTGIFLRSTKLGTVMRALANDREISATLGVPVRRVEAAAWLVSGLISGVAGLILADQVALDATTLTFLVISALAATVIGRLRSLTLTFFGGIVIGLVDALGNPISSVAPYKDMTPFILAVAALLFLSRRGGASARARRVA
ncbi:MAG TPA: branched-chain amino acid ABC transporter permease [Acidimicrobiales bacterium]|nr:branched-chain amino acid ABC transporter permease [Acidimicrobiales bacterium]